jgi:uncharacterized protein
MLPPLTISLALELSHVTPFDISLLAGLIFAAALIYTSVGHAGASGYIAAMALFGLAPAIMRPTALTLNIIVATLATYRWNGAGLTNWKMLVPLLVTSIPAAFIGGAIQLPAHWYRLLVGIVLFVAALKLLLHPRTDGSADRGTIPMPWAAGLLAGGIVGLLSGLTGTGGGIFLSPLLLFFGWAGTRQASGITAPFILVNSLAGLAGNMLSLKGLPAELPYFVIAALLGALAGTSIGIGVASTVMLQRLLGIVLLVAAGKFILV